MSENIIKIHAAGRDWKLLTGDMESLWQEMTEQDPAQLDGWTEDERLPYWAELWPSSLALAAWLEENRSQITGAACLDMGCGLGFTALIGSHLGAHVLGIDYDEQAIRYARENAKRNLSIPAPPAECSSINPVIEWACMDWRKPTVAASSMDYLWAGDIMYEQPFARPIAAFIAHALKPSGTAWIAEPCRTVFEHLVRECSLNTLVIRKLCQRDIWPLQPQKVAVPVNIWEIRHNSFHCGR